MVDPTETGPGDVEDGADEPVPFEMSFPDIEPFSTEDPSIYVDGTTS